jgi:antagonist of KipI
MPVGGAADRSAFLLGNALVGNDAKAVALEFALAGPTLEATERHACVIVGAAFDAWLNEQPVNLWKTFNVAAGDILTIGAARTGLRGYLCVRDGFQGPEILGSRSALDVLRAHETLECEPSSLSPRFIRLDGPRDEPGRLRVLAGSHRALFKNQDFTDRSYQVSPDSNRMGIRLIGSPLVRDGEELLSAPVCPGTVQITNDGQPIVLGVDAQTIGGYPRIAHVISADLDKLAQLRPGSDIQFQWVEFTEAVSLQREHELWLKGWLVRLRVSAG